MKPRLKRAVLVVAVAVLLPVLFPVWTVSWQEVPSIPAKGGGFLSAGSLAQAGFVPVDMAEDMRALLFTGPDKLQPRVERWSFGTKPVQVTWSPQRVRRSLAFGRMVAEAFAVAVPVGLIAILLRWPVTTEARSPGLPESRITPTALPQRPGRLEVSHDR